jgi:hypothetical protein
MSYKSNQEKLVINATGDLTANSLTVTTTIYAGGDITAFSDEALKDDVQPIENALDKVNSLVGVTYIKDGKQSIGLIAQNVEAVIPQAVQKNSEYMSVAYGNLVGVLVQAVKELNEEVKRLKENR